MRRLSFIFFLFYTILSFGQYSNDWIDYSQTYYRIPITAEGVYKVTYADLVANGISVGDFDHRNLQIIHNGQVIPLYVSAQSDGIFRSTDYFEFYVEGGNTGWLDKEVYYTRQPINDAYSLYNDTASYFLTFANTLESPRYDTTRVTDFDDYSLLPYWLRTVRQNYYSTFNTTNNSPYILPSEGWTDAYFDMGGSTQKTLATPHFADVSIDSKISFGLAGYSETQHDILVTVSSDASIRFDTTYYEYNAIHKTLTTSQSLANTTTVTFQSIDGDKTADKNAVSYIEITYPSELICNNTTRYAFTLPIVTNSEKYILLEFTNFNAGSSAPILYCPELGKRILTTATASGYRVLVPNTGKELRCILLSQQAFSHVSSINSIETKNSDKKFLDFSLSENQGDYIIISEKTLWKQAQLYKLYREQTGQKVVLVDIEELYNQFAYGIWKHPYAIIGFLQYAQDNWETEPEHVFLIGRGFHVSEFRKNESNYARTLIPPMGNPAGDLLYTVSPQGKSTRTNIAIGRLATESASDVEIYRKKVAEFESQELKPWMKNVLHFGGGSTTYEQSLFRYYLNQYANTLQGMYFGADVHSFYKATSDVYETTEPEAIRKYMNEGTSLMTFFGHASGSGFDQNVDHPSRFDNQGRYPFIVANSCYSGDIFADNDYNVSRIWVFAENRGSIGFLANVGAGSPSYLNVFSSAFMRNIAFTNYGNSIGSSIAKSLTDVSNRSIIYEDLYDGILGFTLNGDPIVKIHSFDRPDFALTSSSISITPEIVTSDMETFTMRVALSNYGKAYSANYTMKALFSSENSDETFEIDTIVYGSYCHDTIDFTLQTDKFTSGEYNVVVSVDYDNEIEELSEENNEITYSFFISSQEVTPVYPPKFAIVPNDTITLCMSSVDAFNPPTEVLVELDTTKEFNSPLKTSTQIAVDKKSLLQWRPETSLLDSTTYFWRVTATDSIKWNESSFTYEKGKTGWAQIHSKQFSDNTLQRLSYNDTTKKYSFLSIPHEISLQTRGNCSTEKEYFECLFVMDATLMENSGFPLSSPALHIIVLDSTTLDPWMSNKASYGQRNYPQANGRVRYHLAFTSNSTASQKALAQFLLDTVPEGNYILCYSFVKPYCQSWDASLKNAMDSLGFSAYKTTPDDFPYIFYTQKGNPSSCEEVVGDSAKALITFTKKLNANHDDGTISSPLIGPAKTFSKIEWNTTKTGKDYAYLSVNAVTKSNYEYTLRNLFVSELTGLDTLISTDNFPCMRLSCYMQDSSRTPLDLNYWKVYYDPQIELAITPEYAYSISSETLQQGDKVQFITSAKNLSSATSDSLLVMYEIRNEQNELAYVHYKRISSINSYGYIIDTESVATQNFSGKYTVKIEYNPVNPETGEYDIPENIHFNNTYHISFMVEEDNTAPVLDVLVDGRHIINGDNVSIAPEIEITAYDENEFFSIADTSLYSVSITQVATGIEIVYHFSDSSLVLIPTSDGTNIAKILCNPQFTEDGTYELHIQIQDATGNYAASKEYVVQFEVLQEQKVSVLYNFPNPCKDFTTFRFVLTGSSVPTHARIRIIDDKGHEVKEIPISTIHIGTNNIDVYWDGRDKSGIALPNGVYFYQLLFDNKDDWENLTLKNVIDTNKKSGKLLLER